MLIAVLELMRVSVQSSSFSLGGNRLKYELRTSRACLKSVIVLELFFLEKSRDSLLAILCHARDGVDVKARANGRVECHPVNVVEQAL